MPQPAGSRRSQAQGSCRSRNSIKELQCTGEGDGFGRPLVRLHTCYLRVIGWLFTLQGLNSRCTPPRRCTLTLWQRRMPTMIETAFSLIFPPEPTTELAAIKAHPALPAVPGAQDLRNLLWSSIDNDTSKDLDQIEWAEQLPDGRIRVLIGVADVDIRVPRGTPARQTRPIRDDLGLYRASKVFPMLPAELSEGITSLNENEDRVADVV